MDANVLFNALANRQYALALVALVIFAVFLVRKYTGKIPGAVGAFLRSDRGGTVLSHVVGWATTLSVALEAGQKFSWGLLVNVIVGGSMLGGAASGLRDHFWNLKEPADGRTVKGQSLPLTAAILFFILVIPSCITGGTPKPSPVPSDFSQQYLSCVKDQGLASVPGLESDVFAIFSSGGDTATIVKKLETLGVTKGGLVATILVNCAVQTWLNENPVLVNTTPTNRQAAARVYLLRHNTDLAALKAHQPQ